MLSNRVRVGSSVMVLGMSNLSPSSPCPVAAVLPNAAAKLSCAQRKAKQRCQSDRMTRVWAMSSQAQCPEQPRAHVLAATRAATQKTHPERCPLTASKLIRHMRSPCHRTCQQRAQKRLVQVPVQGIEPTSAYATLDDGNAQ